MESRMVDQVLRLESVRCAYQPIMDLGTGEVVAYEALARGPEGPLHSPVALFAAAREAGLLAELDVACRTAAARGAAAQGLVAPLMLFVNVEPQVLTGEDLQDLNRVVAEVPGDLRLVLEFTERALADRPAELLQAAALVQDMGWGLALDDVGADAASLAFMSLLRPDVVKLDLSLVQDEPAPVVAQVMNAVNAYAERSGALILAEGIEHNTHLEMAKALGATLGQGWLFGRPGPGAASQYPTGALTLVPRLSLAATSDLVSPFACLPGDIALRRSPKSLLIEVSKHLEREAMRLGESCVVAAAFQEARHFTTDTARRYRDLVTRNGFVCALGTDLSAEPIPGLRGASLALDDPVRHEWDVVVVSPHFSAALLARDLGDTGPDEDRRFEFALTYQRETVITAAHALVSRITSQESSSAGARLQSPEVLSNRSEA